MLRCFVLERSNSMSKVPQVIDFSVDCRTSEGQCWPSTKIVTSNLFNKSVYVNRIYISHIKGGLFQHAISFHVRTYGTVLPPRALLYGKYLLINMISLLEIVIRHPKNKILSYLVYVHIKCYRCRYMFQPVTCKMDLPNS